MSSAKWRLFPLGLNELTWYKLYAWDTWHSDQIYEYVFLVLAVWGSLAFHLKIYCGFNREPHCFHVFVYINDVPILQTISSLWS